MCIHINEAEIKPPVKATRGRTPSYSRAVKSKSNDPATATRGAGKKSVTSDPATLVEKPAARKRVRAEASLDENVLVFLSKSMRK